MEKDKFLLQNKNKSRKGKLCFFRRRSCFPWYREWRMKRGKTFGEEKFAGRVSEEEQEALDEERLKFFSSLTNKIKNLLQNKLHRPTKIG